MRRIAFCVIAVSTLFHGSGRRPLHAADGVINAKAARPNIVLIMADDMGFSDIGCYGGEIHTPTLDMLAADGLRFTQFYNTGRCCPTRASLLTGLYPHQAGVGWMMTDRGHPGYEGDLNNHCRTIAEALKPAGYSTYMAGKWHVTKHVQPDGPKHNWPRQRGFDRFYGTITGAGSFFDPGTLTRDNTNISPFADPEYQPETYYYTDAISDHAARFITEHEADKPFFLYVAFTAAHWPMHALPDDIAKYKDHYKDGYGPIREARLKRMREMGLVDDWPMVPQAGDWDAVEQKEWETACMQVYAAMVDRMDQGIGNIVASLKASGQFDNTIIFFLQDNGGCQEGNGRKGDFKRPVPASLPTIADDAIRLDVVPKQNRRGVPTLTGPGIMPGPEDTYIAYGLNWANVSNTPFREYKHFVHEGGISTPLIAHWPDGIQRKGELESQPGHLIDIMATCVDLAEADFPATHNGEDIRPLEGLSLTPAFNGDPLNRDAIYWEHEGNRAIREGDWKLVSKENKPWELYDMLADRVELNDLSAAHPDVVERLGGKYDDWADRAFVSPIGTWRGKPKQSNLSKKKRFVLRPGDNLPKENAPNVEDCAIRMVVDLAQAATADDSGVLVAQGGTAEGYSLFVEDGELIFALRRGGQLTMVSGYWPVDQRKLVLTLSADGDLFVVCDGAELITHKLPGPVAKMPVDGLQVGTDLGGLVAPYKGSPEFTGVIEKVVIVLETPKR